MAVLAVVLLQIDPFGEPVADESPGSPDDQIRPTPSSVPRYDREYPTIGYATTNPTGPIAELQARLGRNVIRLEHDEHYGYLYSLLGALDIDISSQVLVFSKTSLQDNGIHPKTPRAIYFNDDTYVAWVRGSGLLEIAAMDPDLGPVFYTLEQESRSKPEFVRETEQCLQCHDSYSLTGGGVPRFLVGSGYTGPSGDLVSHEGWIVTSVRTPLRNRWGGWYVSGMPTDLDHLGNIIVNDPAELANLEDLRVGTPEDLDSLLDTDAYPSNKSDIVALMVLEHQVDVQNAISRVNFDTRTALADEPVDAAQLASMTEVLVKALFSVEEAPLTARLRGTAGFTARFEARGPWDQEGRSLRELDLESRLFEYPLSFLIYSPAFDALLDPVKKQIYTRIAAILRGEDTTWEFAHVSARNRAAVLQILEETKPDFSTVLKR